MAVDRYERSASLLDVPNITDVGSRQALQASQSLQQRLDNISKFALGKLQDKATQEGQMYGVKNAPTLEQITRAVQQNQNVNELFAEEGSVFGNAAREVQADLFRQDSVATFLNKATIAKEGIKEKLITYQDAENIANELQADVNATFDIISGINPEAAVKFNAQASKIGYEVINAARLKAASVEYENQKAQIEQFSANYLDDFEANLFQNKDLVKTMIVTQDIRNDVVNAFGILREPKREVELYKSENAVIQKYIVSQIAEKDTIIQFKDGTDKEFDEILKARNMEGNREAIVTEVLAKEKEMYEIVENAEKQKNKINKEKVDINETEFFSGNSKYTPQKFIAIQRKLGKFYSEQQKNKILNEPRNINPTSAQLENYQNIFNRILLNDIGSNQIKEMWNNNEITSKQWNDLTKEYNKSNMYQDGYKIIKRKLGVLGTELELKEETKNKLNTLLNKFDKEMRERKALGEPLKQTIVALELFDKEEQLILQEEYEEDLQSLENNLKRKIITPGYNKNITAQELLDMSDSEREQFFVNIKKEKRNFNDKVLKNQINKLIKRKRDINAK